MTDFFHLYDVLLEQMDGSAAVSAVCSGARWTAVETRAGLGLAMTTDGNTIAPMLSEPMVGMPLPTLARAVKSWNLQEAGFGLAAVNACFNTPQRLEQLRCAEPFANYCTGGLDLCGKHIGVVGHLRMPESLVRRAASVRILERDPRSGDYPDAACDWLLPQCDVVLITAAALVNKTLPHLLELCRDACTILTGPSCPMCPALLELGIDRLAGLVITDRAAALQAVKQGDSCSPYAFGTPFLLTRERL